MPKKKQKDTTQSFLVYPDDTATFPVENSDLFKTLFTCNSESLERQTESKLVFSHENGLLFQGDCIRWFAFLKDESVDLIFADPPYNIKKAEWDFFESQEQYIQWSMTWIKEAARVLKPTGTLYICGFSEILADLKHPAMKYFKGCKWLVWRWVCCC